MKSRRNFILDAICRAVGFSATINLMRWCGGRNIYVPGKVIEDHLLVRVLGAHAFSRLVEEFGDQTLWIPAEPLARYKAADENHRAVVKLIADGHTPRMAAEQVGLSVRQVQRICAALPLEQVGLSVRQVQRICAALPLEQVASLPS